MSSPDWRWMKPNPLLALNHFTVPCSFTVFPFHCFELFGASRPPPAVQQKKATSLYSQPLYIESKGFTRATNAIAQYHEFRWEPNDFHRVGRSCGKQEISQPLRPLRNSRRSGHSKIQRRV